jgi:hypothetical protein
LHYHPQIYKNTIKGYLIYTPGVLLRNDKGKIAPDWNEVITDDKLDFNSYYSLYERRLFPVFEYINAISKDKKAFITIPGLGCGQFAGKFQGQLGAVFKNVLVKLLENHGMKFSNIKAVYYDPYSECINERFEINNISLLVRPLLQSNENKPQLCEPSLYQENNDDFNDTELFSIVAWDHVSWPGNDFYDNSRATDDGVKAAATDSMFKITGVEGAYNIETNKYTAPKKYKNWEDVVYQNNIKLKLLN